MESWKSHHPEGQRRVVVTKELPGARWLELLIRAGCRVDVCTRTEILGTDEIIEAIGSRCDGAIGQLTEGWGRALFKALKNAGGMAYSNYAVGYNNVDVEAATDLGIPVGNTPGVLTETTAEMALALTFAAARRVVESDTYMRAGRFKGWLPTLFLGELLHRKTLGIIGAGRIGGAFARMMVQAQKTDLIYYDIRRSHTLEQFVKAYNGFLKTLGENPVLCRRTQTMEELLREADVVSLHTVLDETTAHMINRKSLSMMKENAILVNTSRGPLIDEAALVEHCRSHPHFRAALDVFEDEPAMKPGLSHLENVVIVPHIGSATIWTREGMATLAAANVSALLMGYPVWQNPDITPFLTDDPPKAAPSVVNAEALGLPVFNP